MFAKLNSKNLSSIFVRGIKVSDFSNWVLVNFSVWFVEKLFVAVTFDNSNLFFNSLNMLRTEIPLYQTYITLYF